MNNKTVSIVMCTFNGEKYIKEQLDSILSQTYPIKEIIIQDDCSTDQTINILKQYATTNKTIKLYINKHRLGLNHNFSLAFSKASGDFIACSDQDDIWKKDKIEKLMNYMQKEEYTLVFHNSITFTENIQKTGIKRHPDSFKYDDSSVLLKLFICGHECLFQNKILSLYNKAYEQEPNICYDQLLMITATAAGKTKYIEEDLVYWRRHSQAASIIIPDPAPVYNTITGFIAAIQTLWNHKKRDVARRFFHAFSFYHFEDSNANAIVTGFSSGKLIDIFKICFLCGIYEKKIFYPNHHGIRVWIKSFFTPLYFIRDCTTYLIK